jgi:hypothetical protein
VTGVRKTGLPSLSLGSSSGPEIKPDRKPSQVAERALIIFGRTADSRGAAYLLHDTAENIQHSGFDGLREFSGDTSIPRKIIDILMGAPYIGRAQGLLLQFDDFSRTLTRMLFSWLAIIVDLALTTPTIKAHYIIAQAITVQYNHVERNRRYGHSEV